MKVLHTKATGDFIYKNASMVTDGVDKYYYFPFYLKDVNGTGMFEEIPFERLPPHIVDLIKQNREMRRTSE